MQNEINKNNLLNICNEKQIQQRDLAEKIGTTEAYVSMIAKGKRTPSLPIAKKIAKELHKSIEDIF